MKKFLVLAAMLSVILFSFGTSHAVLGVADDVPGNDVVFPIICEVGGGLNTVWALGSLSDTNDTTLFELLPFNVFDERTRFVFNFLDEASTWEYDVVPNDCASIVALMSTAQKNMLLKTIGGRQYYVGYIVYNGGPAFADTPNFLIPWVYLVDLQRGFASSFNGFSAEFALTPRLAEDGVPVTARYLYPRYFFLNGLPETWNWWIILAGRNEYGAAQTLFDLGLIEIGLGGSFTRSLDGIICNEVEVCISLRIPLPNELNIINVGEHLPAGLHSAFPKGGFADFQILESLTLGGASAATMRGTIDPLHWFESGGTQGYYSIFGWAYQRAAESTLAASWDVIHPIHRNYCDFETSFFPTLPTWIWGKPIFDGDFVGCTLSGFAVSLMQMPQ